MVLRELQPRTVRESFHLVDIEQDFFRVFERTSTAATRCALCRQCGTLNPRPTRLRTGRGLRGGHHLTPCAVRNLTDLARRRSAAGGAAQHCGGGPPLAIGIATGHQAAGLAATSGALNTMFSDQPGPYRLRMARMLAARWARTWRRWSASLVGASTPGHAWWSSRFRWSAE